MSAGCALSVVLLMYYSYFAAYRGRDIRVTVGSLARRKCWQIKLPPFEFVARKNEPQAYRGDGTSAATPPRPPRGSNCDLPHRALIATESQAVGPM